MSEKLQGACIFGQSGGPTAVINASAYGVIRTALDSEEITDVYGAYHGIKGVLNDQLFDMAKEDPDELELLKHTPSSELGSCRYKMKDPEEDDSDYRRILEIFKKYNVRYFFYNGGNDSMDTCNKISKYMKQVGYACHVIGVPKTIDNDLYGTDHCPGYPSAAKYIATTCMEIAKDARVYDTPQITVIEIMGRHAGWLAGASSLATYKGSGPDLIYLPECVFDLKKFDADIEDVYKSRHGKVFVAVSEGIHYADGTFVSEAKASSTDGFGHAQLGGLASLLAAHLKEKFNTKVRGIELSLLQRCGSHLASQTDLDEAVLVGQVAVKEAIKGTTDVMIALKRTYIGSEYVGEIELLPLAKVANFEKKVPLNWINESRNFVTNDFIDYVLPLIQGQPEIPYEESLPRYARLKKVFVSR
jgi:6-phosphofructokinase